MGVTAERRPGVDLQRLALVALLVPLPLAFPLAWVVGLGVMAVERPRGWVLTVALCPVGFFLPIYLYGQATSGDLPVGLAGPAALLAVGNLVAAYRVMSR